MSSVAPQETDLRALLEAAINALRQSSELIERHVWSVAPEEAAGAQKKNNQTMRQLRAAVEREGAF